MKFFLSIISLFIFTFSASAQSDSLDVNWNYIDSIFNYSGNNKTIQPIDELLNSEFITNGDIKIELLSRKNLMHIYITPFNKKDNEQKLINKAESLLNTFDSLEYQSNCQTKNTIEFHRYVLLSNLIQTYHRKLPNKYTSMYLQKKRKLKSKGFRPEREGLSIGLLYSQGHEEWLGLDVSILSYYQAPFHIKSDCEKQKNSLKGSTGFFNALTLGYSKSLSSRINDFSFSLIDINSPFVLAPANFGVQNLPKNNKNYFYYRPKIGIRIGYVFLAYSYNFMFAKSIRDKSEKHMGYIKFSYPIINYNNRHKRVKQE